MRFMRRREVEAKKGLSISESSGMIRSKKIRDAARGEPCCFRLAGCTGGGEDSVWCHSRYGEDGGGIGLKAHDLLGAIGCSRCHDEYDGRTHRLEISRDDMRDIFHQAMKRSLVRLWEKGVIK